MVRQLVCFEKKPVDHVIPFRVGAAVGRHVFDDCFKHRSWTARASRRSLWSGWWLQLYGLFFEAVDYNGVF
jgi:hypothetical protein